MVPGRVVVPGVWWRIRVRCAARDGAMSWIRHKAVITVAAAAVLAGFAGALLAACQHAPAPPHARQLRSPLLPP